MKLKALYWLLKSGIPTFCLFIFLLHSASIAQVNRNIGQLRIENFSPKVYKAHPQNWAITQDFEGRMYFGNKEGILIYDGFGWEMVLTSNEGTVRSLDVSPTGKVYAGGVNDFGYLESNYLGELSFISLPGLYNLQPEEIGDVYYTHAFYDGVYFMTNQKIYFYDGRSLRFWESESAFQSCYKINNKLIINQLSTGLCVMVDDSITPIFNANDFRQIRLYDIIRYSENDMLVLTERYGIYSFFKNTVSREYGEAYRTRINTEIRNFNPFNGAIIRNNILSIGTWGHGLLLVDKEGDIIQKVDHEMGLADEVIIEQFVDREKNLWLATSNGISRISINDRIVEYGDRAGVNETVEKIVEFDGKMFIGTHTGLYRWVEGNKNGIFKKVDGISTECWDILPLEIDGKKSMLVAGNNAIYQVWEDLSIDLVVSCLPWTFHQLKSEPNTIFVGLDDGLMCIRYLDGTWRMQNKIAGIDETIYHISETNENELWLGTLDNGVIRLKLEKSRTLNAFRFEIEKMNHKKGLPEGGVFSETYQGEPIFGTSSGIYQYNRREMNFTPLVKLNNARGKENFVVHRLSESPDGKLYMVAYRNDEFHLGYFEESDEGMKWMNNDFLPLSLEVFHDIYHSSTEDVWFGGPTGLYNYRPPKQTETGDFDFSTVIRRIYLNKDSLHFAGFDNALNYGDTVIAKPARLKIPYENNSISFTYSSQYQKYPDQNLYSHKLEGFDDEWSEWSRDNKSVYTNLFEGNYTFMAKSKNAYGVESGISTYSFLVKAPWFRTWWAYLIYTVGLFFMVWGIIILYTRRLKRIIKIKTAEVVEQKEEIEKQKDEVESQRKLLEIKNSDITSSINYAKRLQSALLPDDRLISKYLSDSFILYKPKDIVSGDFYWMEHVNGQPDRDYTLFAAVDCTGHGVPGAFVSVVGNSGLNRAVNQYGLHDPAKILEKLNEIVVDTLSKGDSELRDGMDISLCRFDFRNMKLQFAGANNNAYLVRKGIGNENHGLNGSTKLFKEDMVELKANKQPVGYYEFREDFVNTEVKLKKGDIIYLFSDGFPDQFGGPNGKKYNYPRFKDFLVSISDKPMSEQKSLIESEFERWKSGEDQIDDIVVAGIRV